MIQAVGSRSSELGGALEKSISGEDFLKLFTSEMQAQDPMNPMSNQDMLSQVAQITNLEMMKDLSKNIQDLMGHNSVMQASGMLGKTVEYRGPDGTLKQALVVDVQVGRNDEIRLGLSSKDTVLVADVTRIS